MQTEITISELAKLMQVSVHQIRYFEEKGILLPSYTDSNQYRRYERIRSTGWPIFCCFVSWAYRCRG